MDGTSIQDQGEAHAQEAQGPRRSGRGGLHRRSADGFGRPNGNDRRDEDPTEARGRGRQSSRAPSLTSSWPSTRTATPASTWRSTTPTRTTTLTRTATPTPTAATPTRPPATTGTAVLPLPLHRRVLQQPRRSLLRRRPVVPVERPMRPTATRVPTPRRNGQHHRRGKAAAEQQRDRCRSARRRPTLRQHGDGDGWRSDLRFVGRWSATAASSTPTGAHGPGRAVGEANRRGRRVGPPECVRPTAATTRRSTSPCSPTTPIRTSTPMPTVATPTATRAALAEASAASGSGRRRRLRPPTRPMPRVATVARPRRQHQRRSNTATARNNITTGDASSTNSASIDHAEPDQRLRPTRPRPPATAADRPPANTEGGGASGPAPFFVLDTHEGRAHETSTPDSRSRCHDAGDGWDRRLCAGGTTS